MAAERECWFNIYPKVYGDRQIGLPHWSKAGADKALRGRRATVECRNTPAFRIHVRLKPEGAPKRYADARDRWCWERWPQSMRQGVGQEIMLELHAGDLAAGCIDIVEAA